MRNSAFLHPYLRAEDCPERGGVRAGALQYSAKRRCARVPGVRGPQTSQQGRSTPGAAILRTLACDGRTKKVVRNAWLQLCAGARAHTASLKERPAKTPPDVRNNTPVNHGSAKSRHRRRKTSPARRNRFGLFGLAAEARVY